MPHVGQELDAVFAEQFDEGLDRSRGVADGPDRRWGGVVGWHCVIPRCQRAASMLAGYTDCMVSSGRGSFGLAGNVMNAFLLHSTKYDGSLHYRYPVDVVEATDERLATFFSPGKLIESHRGSWTSQKHFLSMFWREKPYVLHVRWDKEWKPEFLYVDIATGTNWTEQVVRYIDLDLDLILASGSTSVHLDDADEFETHRHRWSYPAELVQACWAAVEDVRGLLQNGHGPFTAKMFDWRPGKPLGV